MKSGLKTRITAISSFLIIGLMALFYACDTPKSIAWSYYGCAKDTLAAGDPFAAKHFLDACNVTADKKLAIKADSLRRVIEQAIEEKQKDKSEKQIR
ncbi:MAG: hypothetical protein K6C10_00655 [Prevotella sp.]|nr:hypothetical protein [Prevotella sp.]